MSLWKQKRLYLNLVRIKVRFKLRFIALYKKIFSEGHNEEERVYTDSMFWCGPGLVRKMVAFAEECEDLYRNETCIYGDFLACMGSRPAEQKLYWKNVSNSSAIKRKIASNFGDTSLNILILERSHFYHLGTMPECKYYLPVCVCARNTSTLYYF
jgi:hypothetical protein